MVKFEGFSRGKNLGRFSEEAIGASTSFDGEVTKAEYVKDKNGKAKASANGNKQIKINVKVTNTKGDKSFSNYVNVLLGFKGNLTTSGPSLKISALRSATALQKYKEIQNSNDPDFANQVLAHFGIKPKVDARTSIFIGGDDKTLSINPQVNTNFLDGGQPDIKAIGS